MVQKDPRLFPILFVGMLVGISFTLSAISGWFRLGLKFKTKDKFLGKKWFMQSFSMNHVSYNGCVTIGANGSHLYLSVILPLRVAHPKLFIPWGEIVGQESKGVLFKCVNLKFDSVPYVNLSLSKRQADRLEIASDNVWLYKRV